MESVERSVRGTISSEKQGCCKAKICMQELSPMRGMWTGERLSAAISNVQNLFSVVEPTGRDSRGEEI